MTHGRVLKVNCIKHNPIQNLVNNQVSIFVVLEKSILVYLSVLITFKSNIYTMVASTSNFAHLILLSTERDANWYESIALGVVEKLQDGSYRAFCGGKDS